VIIVLVAITVAADRMVGALLCFSLIMHAVITWRRDVIAVSIFATGLFAILFMTSYSLADAGVGSIDALAEKTQAFYDPKNLIVFFAIANGLLIAPAIIGFLRMKNHLLKVPLLVSTAGSFSWLVFPNMDQFVADRWVILAGIFLSVFACYGILQIIKNFKPRISVMIASIVLAVFLAIGLAYAVMPYDSPFILYGVARYSIENFGPVTMQFNSLDIQDNDKLLSAIQWINQHTERDAVIVGEKHWRGFMELYLKDERTYRFSDDPRALGIALERQGKPVYEITFDPSSLQMFTVEDVAIR
jgi:hypothetical protein